MVIHEGIDGFSRRIMYLHASDNNRSDTVLRLFMNSVNTFGLPSRVRGDRGGENVGVSNFMIGYPLKGPGRGSFIAGRSVHNQRIERLWRDVFSSCTVLFYNVFWYMEEEQLLDVENEIHLFAMHYVFLPRINMAIHQFVLAWNNHTLSSERNMSPVQLWISGLCSSPPVSTTEESNTEV